jgi:hypothetical protein
MDGNGPQPLRLLKTKDSQRILNTHKDTQKMLLRSEPWSGGMASVVEALSSKP